MYSFSQCSQLCTLCTYLLDFLPTRFHTYWFSYPPNFIPTCFPTYYISYLLVLYLLYFLPTSPPPLPGRRPALSLSLGCSLRRRRRRCRRGRPLALRLLAVSSLCGSFSQLVKLLVHLLQFPESHKSPNKPSTFLHAGFNKIMLSSCELS